MPEQFARPVTSLLIVVAAVVMMTVVMMTAVNYHHHLRLRRIGHHKADKEQQR